MTKASFGIPVIGTLAQLITNELGLYEGDLKHYFKVVWNAPNVRGSYHNFRHMTHVPWLCGSALLYYREKGLPFGLRVARNLLIAGLTHDLDHTGQTADDDRNIRQAISALDKCILDVDRPYFRTIALMIKDATRFPYQVKAEDLSIDGKILRDADKSQTFSVAWIQQIIFGLSDEVGVTPTQMLEGQEPFLRSIHFSTDWAKEVFGPEIEAKIEESKKLIEILS